MYISQMLISLIVITFIRQTIEIQCNFFGVNRFLIAQYMETVIIEILQMILSALNKFIVLCVPFSSLFIYMYMYTYPKSIVLP